MGPGAAGQLAPLRPRAGRGVPSWRPLEAGRFSGVRPAAKMACAVFLDARAWPPWAFCAAFSRPFPHRGGQQLPGLPGAPQRGRRPPPAAALCGPPCKQVGRLLPEAGTERSPPSRRFAAPAAHPERARGAGAFQLPVVAGPRLGRARPGGDRAQVCAQGGPLAGDSQVSLSVVPPAALQLELASFPPQGRT